jgi:hypothetical protein
VHGWRKVALTRAIANIRRVILDGAAPHFLVRESDRMA